MRGLYAGDDFECEGSVGGESEADGGGGAGSDFGEPLPLHGIQEDRRGNSESASAIGK